MSDIFSTPATARILQISPTETITYDMPLATYELIRDVLDNWLLYHSRRDKGTVEKALCILSRAGEALGFDPRKDVVVMRKPTINEIKGLRAGVWYDGFGFSKEGEGES